MPPPKDVPADAFEQELARGQAIMQSDSLVSRFCAYGFLKNLKFFEPFLITLLLGWGYSLTVIGSLVSVEKLTNYVCSLPAGYFADKFGLRRVLCSCFMAYIVAFVFYFLGENDFRALLVAAFFYGLAEALRSGVHKAMVFLWLDQHDLRLLKSFLNGKTRSYSLLGSAVAAVGGIFISLHYTGGSDSNYIFLFSIVPYLLDFAVVASYPDYMDGGAPEKKKKTTTKKKGGDGASRSLSDDLRALLAILRRGDLRRPFLSSVALSGTHRLLKDFIQPVLLLYGPYVLAGMRRLPPALDPVPPHEKWSHGARVVVQGLLYMVLYLCSVPAARNAYRLTQRAAAAAKPSGSGDDGGGNGAARLAGKGVMDALLVLYSVLLLGCGVALYSRTILPVLGLYVALYVTYNLFKPTSTGAIADLAGKGLRATVFSADSLLQTMLVAALAPLVGYIADAYSIEIVFAAVGGALMALNVLVLAEWSLMVTVLGGKTGSAAEVSGLPQPQLSSARPPKEDGEAGGSSDAPPVALEAYSAI